MDMEPPAVRDTVLSYLGRQPALVSNMASMEPTMLAEMLRKHMETLLSEDRQQHFGQPAFATSGGRASA